MTLGWIQLRSFTEKELIFDDVETRAILKFFFLADQQLIDTAPVTNSLRNFAQGLLVEAVDASFALGLIELTFRWAVNPGPGLKKALQKLARSAARHWFKHRKDQSLLDARIYERVRDQLTRSFRSPFRIVIQAKADGERRVGSIGFEDYGALGSNSRAPV